MSDRLADQPPHLQSIVSSWLVSPMLEMNIFYPPVQDRTNGKQFGPSPTPLQTPAPLGPDGTLG